MSDKAEKGGKGGKKGKGGQKDGQKDGKIDVPATPKLKTLRNWNVQEGQKATLKCELLSGGKQTKIKWYLNNIEISGNKTRKIKLKKKGTLSELRLLKVTDADVGTYTCKAVNERGEDAQYASVTVIKAATSTTPSAKTSSHTTRCSEKDKSYCVNGGECFTLNVTPNTTKRLCRCPQGFTGNRCQTKVPVRVTKHEQHHGIELMEAEELYQKRVLTITGICIALLVVGIMCVVAYCKTKKQRQKLHDRLRQSIRNRNAMADTGNGPQHLQKHHTPPQTLQLVNYAPKNPACPEHVMEKEKETSFTFCQNTMCSRSPTAATHASSQCWSNNIVSDTRPVLGVLSGQNSRNGTPSHRGRLNAIGGAREVSDYMKTSRETPNSYKESPNSQRDVSNVTTHPSPVKLLSPATPLSPPSEISTALPSLATSVPSMATSPSVGDERPLLYLTPPPLREKPQPGRARQLRNSAHYNHGLEEISPPTSPHHTPEEELLNTIQEGDCSMPSSATHSPTATHISKRTNPEAKNPQEEQKASSEDSSESSSSESETDEEERMAENKPFLLQNPGALGMAVLGLELTDSSRTNTALHLSPQEDLQSRLTSVMVKQDPIAV